MTTHASLAVVGALWREAATDSGIMGIRDGMTAVLHRDLTSLLAGLVPSYPSRWRHIFMMHRNRSNKTEQDPVRGLLVASDQVRRMAAAWPARPDRRRSAIHAYSSPGAFEQLADEVSEAWGTASAAIGRLASCYLRHVP
jgi:hypothetical protein